MPSAAFTASVACADSDTGAPQKAITQSPMYLSMVPRCWRMTCVSRVKISLSKACSCTGSMRSDMAVKPRMSQNMTVSSRLAACMLYRSGSRTISFTSSGGT